MLHEYLTEDEEGGGTARSQIASINDVLKGSSSTRGTSKVSHGHSRLGPDS